METRNLPLERAFATSAQDRIPASTAMFELSLGELDAVAGGATTTTVWFRRNGTVKKIQTTTTD